MREAKQIDAETRESYQVRQPVSKNKLWKAGDSVVAFKTIGAVTEGFTYEVLRDSDGTSFVIKYDDKFQRAAIYPKANFKRIERCQVQASTS